MPPKKREKKENIKSNNCQMRSRGAPRESEREKERPRARGHTSQFIHSHMFDVMCCVLCVCVCVCVWDHKKADEKCACIRCTTLHAYFKSVFQPLLVYNPVQGIAD